MYKGPGSRVLLTKNVHPDRGLSKVCEKTLGLPRRAKVLCPARELMVRDRRGSGYQPRAMSQSTEAILGLLCVPFLLARPWVLLGRELRTLITWDYNTHWLPEQT